MATDKDKDKEKEMLDVTISEVDPKDGLNKETNSGDSSGLDVQIGTPIKRDIGGPVDFDFDAGARYDKLNEYDAFLGNVSPKYQNYQRAVSQGVGSELKNKAIQLLPNIAFGLLESVGYIADLENYAGVLGSMQTDYKNWLSDEAKKGSEWMREAAPVYVENPGDPLDFTDSGAWVNFGGGIIESGASFALTGAGIGAALKGVQYMSTGAKALAAATALTTAEGAMTAGDRYVSTEKTILDLLRYYKPTGYTTVSEEGETVSAESSYISSLNDASKYPSIGPEPDINPEFFKRYEEYRTKALNTDPNLTEDEIKKSYARELASDAASTTMRMNYANVALNMTGMAAMFKGTKRFRELANQKLKIQRGEQLLDYSARLAQEGKKYAPSFLKVLGGEMVQESFEEYINEASSKEGYNTFLKEAGLQDDIQASKSFIDRSLDTFFTKESGVAMLGGAFGAIVQTSALQGPNHGRIVRETQAQVDYLQKKSNTLLNSTKVLEQIRTGELKKEDGSEFTAAELAFKEIQHENVITSVLNSDFSVDNSVALGEALIPLYEQAINEDGRNVYGEGYDERFNRHKVENVKNDYDYIIKETNKIKNNNKLSQDQKLDLMNSLLKKTYYENITSDINFKIETNREQLDSDPNVSEVDKQAGELFGLTHAANALEDLIKQGKASKAQVEYLEYINKRRENSITNLRDLMQLQDLDAEITSDQVRDFIKGSFNDYATSLASPYKKDIKDKLTTNALLTGEYHLASAEFNTIEEIESWITDKDNTELYSEMKGVTNDIQDSIYDLSRLKLVLASDQVDLEDASAQLDNIDFKGFKSRLSDIINKIDNPTVVSDMKDLLKQVEKEESEIKEALNKAQEAKSNEVKEENSQKQQEELVEEEQAESEVNTELTEEENEDNQEVPNDEYDNFINNGIVTEERIEAIAKKIISQQTLNKRELAIMADKTSEINNKIVELQKQEEQAQEEPTEDNEELKKEIKKTADTLKEEKSEEDQELLEEIVEELDEELDSLDQLNEILRKATAEKKAPKVLGDEAVNSIITFYNFVNSSTSNANVEAFINEAFSNGLITKQQRELLRSFVSDIKRSDFNNVKNLAKQDFLTFVKNQLSTNNSRIQTDQSVIKSLEKQQSLINSILDLKVLTEKGSTKLKAIHEKMSEIKKSATTVTSDDKIDYDKKIADIKKEIEEFRKQSRGMAYSLPVHLLTKMAYLYFKLSGAQFAKFFNKLRDDLVQLAKSTDSQNKLTDEELSQIVTQQLAENFEEITNAIDLFREELKKQYGLESETDEDLLMNEAFKENFSNILGINYEALLQLKEDFKNNKTNKLLDLLNKVKGDVEFTTTEGVVKTLLPTKNIVESIEKAIIHHERYRGIKKGETLKTKTTNYTYTPYYDAELKATYLETNKVLLFDDIKIPIDSSIFFDFDKLNSKKILPGSKVNMQVENALDNWYYTPFEEDKGVTVEYKEVKGRTVPALKLFVPKGMSPVQAARQPYESEEVTIRTEDPNNPKRKIVSKVFRLKLDGDGKPVPIKTNEKGKLVHQSIEYAIAPIRIYDSEIPGSKPVSQLTVGVNSEIRKRIFKKLVKHNKKTGLPVLNEGSGKYELNNPIFATVTDKITEFSNIEVDEETGNKVFKSLSNFFKRLNKKEAALGVKPENRTKPAYGIVRSVGKRTANIDVFTKDVNGNLVRKELNVLDKLGNLELGTQVIAIETGIESKGNENGYRVFVVSNQQIQSAVLSTDNTAFGVFEKSIESILLEANKNKADTGLANKFINLLKSLVYVKTTLKVGASSIENGITFNDDINPASNKKPNFRDSISITGNITKGSFNGTYSLGFNIDDIFQEVSFLEDGSIGEVKRYGSFVQFPVQGFLDFLSGKTQFMYATLKSDSEGNRIKSGAFRQIKLTRKGNLVTYTTGVYDSSQRKYIPTNPLPQPIDLMNQFFNKVMESNFSPNLRMLNSEETGEKYQGFNKGEESGTNSEAAGDYLDFVLDNVQTPMNPEQPFYNSVIELGSPELSEIKEEATKEQQEAAVKKEEETAAANKLFEQKEKVQKELQEKRKKKAEEKPKVDPGLPGLDDLFSSTSEGTPAYNKTLNEETEKVKKLFPKIPITVSERLIKLGNYNVNGLFNKSGILVSRFSDEGTTYHEGFHAVFRLSTTDRERKSLLKQAAKRYKIDNKKLNELRDLYPGLNNQDILDLFYEEQLAEDFKEFVLSRKERSLPKRILDFFKDLWYYLKNMIYDNTIDSYFKINSNPLFSNKRILRPLTDFDTAYSIIPGFTDLKHQELAIRYLNDNMLNKLGNLSDIVDNPDITYDIVMESYKEVLFDLSSQYLGLTNSEHNKLTNSIKIEFDLNEQTAENSDLRIELDSLKDDYGLITEDQFNQLLNPDSFFTYFLALNNLVKALAIYNDNKTDDAITLDSLNLKERTTRVKELYAQSERVRPDNTDKDKLAVSAIFNNLLDVDLKGKKLKDGSTIVSGSQKGILSLALRDLKQYNISAIASGLQEVRETIYDKPFIQRDIKSAVSKNVRRLLSNLSSDDGDVIFNKNTSKLFDYVYSFLLRKLGTADTYEDMIQILELELKKRDSGHIKELITKLNEASEDVRNAFFSEFRKQNVNLILVKSELVKGRVNTKLIQLNNSSLENKIFDNWMQSEEIMVDNPEESITQNKRVNKELSKKLNSKQITQVDHKQNDADFAMEIAEEIVNNLNLIFDDEMKGENRSSELDKNDWGMAIFNHLQTSSNAFDAKKTLAAKLYNAVKGIQKGSTDFNNKEAENAMLKQKSNLMPFARIKAEQTQSTYVGTMRDSNNNLIYSINLPNHIANVKDKLKNGNSQLTKELKNTSTVNPGGNLDMNAELSKFSSFYMREMFTPGGSHSGMAENFNLFLLDAMKKGEETNPTDYSNMFAKDHDVALYNLFYNNNVSSSFFYRVPPLADKPNLNILNVPKISSLSEALSEIKNLLVQDLNKINQVIYTQDNIEDENQLVKNFEYKDKGGVKVLEEANGLKFTVLPHLNKYVNLQEIHKFFRNEVSDFEGMSKKQVKEALMSTLQDLNKMYFLGLNHDILLNKLTNTADPSLKKFYDRMFKAESVQSFNPVTDSIRGQQVSKFINTKDNLILSNVDSKVKDSIMDAISKGTRDKGKVNDKMNEVHRKFVNKPTEDLITMFVLNYAIATQEVLKFTASDLAFYKNTDNFGKRFGQHATSGTAGNFAETDTFRMVTVKDVFKNLDEDSDRYKNWLQSLIDSGLDEAQAKQILEPYVSGSNVADGQGFISLKRYVEIRKSRGKWDDNVEGKALAALEAGTATPSDIKIILQPLKTFTYGLQPVKRKLKDGTIQEIHIPTQIKHSTIPLIEALTKDNPEFQKLKDAMEAKQIDEVNFDSAIKVGNRSEIEFDTFLNEELNDEYVQNIYSKYQLIPQEIPEEKTKMPLWGSQIRKLITANVLKDSDYNGITGEQIIQRYQTVGASLVNKSIIDLEERLGLTDLYRAMKSETLGGDPEVTREARHKFLVNVKEELLRSLEQRDLPDIYYDILTLIEQNRNLDFRVSLGYPAYQTKFENVIFSIFKNNVIKQRMNGGSLVQVADIGYKTDDSLDYKATPEGGLEIEVRLPLKLLKGNNKDLKIEDIQDIEELSEIIGYRIPTQNKSSMMKIKVVGFTPEESGSMIMVPAELTTQTGGDFDIDKLYLMVPNLYIDKKTKKAYIPKLSSKLFEFNELDAQGKREALIEDYNNTIKHLRDTTDRLSKLIESTYKAEYNVTRSLKDDDYRDLRSFTEEDLENQIDFSGRREEFQEYLEKEQKKLGDLLRGKNGKNSLETYIDERINKSLDQILVEKPKSLLQNSVIDIYKNILGSNNHIQELSTALDDPTFGRLRDNVNNAYNVDPDPDINNPNTATSLALRNMAGKALVGIFATNVVSHSQSQLSRTVMNRDLVSMIDNTFKSNGTLSGVKVAGQNGYIDFTLSLLINLAVDNANDPIAGDLNINNYTAGILSLLTRMGVDVNESVAFLNQKEVRDLVTEMQDNKTPIGNIPYFINSFLARNYKVKSDIGTKKVEKLLREGGYSNVKVTLSALNTEPGAQKAHDTLKLFYILNQAANDLTSINKVLNADRLEASSVFDMAEWFKNKDKAVDPDSGLMYLEESTIPKMSRAFLKGHTKSLDFLRMLIPYLKPNFLYNFTDAIEIYTGDTANAKDIKKMLNEFLYFSFTEFIPELSPNSELASKVVERTRELKYNKEGTNNLINTLEINDGRIIFDSNLLSDNNDANAISDSWLALYNDPVTKQYAVDLLKYAYMYDGFEFSPRTFTSYAPIEILEEIGLPEAFKKLESKLVTGAIPKIYAERFFEQLLLNKPEFINSVDMNYFSNSEGQNFGRYVIADDKNNNVKYLYRLVNVDSKGRHSYMLVKELEEKLQATVMKNYDVNKDIEEDFTPVVYKSEAVNPNYLADANEFYDDAVTSMSLDNILTDREFGGRVVLDARLPNNSEYGYSASIYDKFNKLKTVNFSYVSSITLTVDDINKADTLVKNIKYKNFYSALRAVIAEKYSNMDTDAFELMLETFASPYGVYTNKAIRNSNTFKEAIGLTSGVNSVNLNAYNTQSISNSKDELVGEFIEKPETSRGFKLPIDKTGKDQGKADLANAYIGYKVPNRNSSTGQYLDKAIELGMPTNESIQPDSNTFAFVSVASEGTNNQRTIEQAKRVIEAGGTVIMDASGTGFGKSHSRFNKKGEGVVQDALGTPTGQTSKGYNYWGKNPETTQQESTSKTTTINKERWSKDSPKQNTNTAYIFTENINSIGGTRVGAGSAVIRNNPNAIGIVTKKYYTYKENRNQQNRNQWNQNFQDTDADFELFKRVNLEQFDKIDKFESKIFPDSFASSLASIPNRFAIWLQDQLLNRYGLVTELNSDGTGLISKEITEVTKAEKTEIQVDKSMSFGQLLNLVKDEKTIFTSKGVYTMRTSGKEHFGNPFTGTKSVADKNPNLILMNSVQEAVTAYKEWLLGVEDSNALKVQDMKTKVGSYSKLGTSLNSLRDSLINNVEERDNIISEHKEVLKTYIKAMFELTGVNPFILDDIGDYKEYGSGDSLDTLDSYFKLLLPEYENHQITNILNYYPDIVKSVAMTHKTALLSEYEGDTGLPSNLNELNKKKYEKIEPERRQWILDQISSGALDNTTLLYMNDRTGYKSHADVLAEIVNLKNDLSEIQVDKTDPKEGFNDDNSMDNCK